MVAGSASGSMDLPHDTSLPGVVLAAKEQSGSTIHSKQKVQRVNMRFEHFPNPAFVRRPVALLGGNERRGVLNTGGIESDTCKGTAAVVWAAPKVERAFIRQGLQPRIYERILHAANPRRKFGTRASLRAGFPIFTLGERSRHSTVK